MSVTPPTDEAAKHWLVRKETIRRLWWIGGAILAVLAIGDVAIDGYAGFKIDGTFAFYAWYGLVTCMAMVLFAKALGVVLKRPDSYYDGGDAGEDGDV